MPKEKVYLRIINFGDETITSISRANFNSCWKEDYDILGGEQLHGWPRKESYPSNLTKENVIDLLKSEFDQVVELTTEEIEKYV